MAKTPITPERKLQLETEAAKVLIAQIAESGMGEDSDLIRDMVEGETALLEAVGQIVSSIVLEDEVALDGIAKASQFLTDRKRQVEARVERKKAMIMTAMQIAEQTSIKTALKTVSLKATPPKLEVTDESLIPADFWKPADPTLDRKGLGDRLKARAALIDEAMKIDDAEARAKHLALIDETSPEIPGAVLSNGGQTIQFR